MGDITESESIVNSILEQPGLKGLTKLPIKPTRYIQEPDYIPYPVLHPDWPSSKNRSCAICKALHSQEVRQVVRFARKYQALYLRPRAIDITVQDAVAAGVGTNGSRLLLSCAGDLAAAIGRKPVAGLFPVGRCAKVECAWEAAVC